ncbi:MAG: transcription elongation factor GreA [bacterium]|nr:transcription elongation factor GreA [bacterium]
MTNNNSEFLSKERFEEIKKELEDLKTNKRKEIADRLEYAKSMGDLSENAEYKEAKEALDMLEDRIAHLGDVVRRAVVIKTGDGDTVQLGCSVKIKKAGSGDIKEFRVVGPEEVDITKAKISNLSPMGAALMGRKKGDEFAVKSPNGEIKYKILDIS